MTVLPYTLADAQEALPRYGAQSHKYTHGTLVVAGGSRRYAGAPLLAATSALYAGAGVVIACIPQAAAPLCRIPQALIVHKLPGDEGTGTFAANSIGAWNCELPKATALVLGPGMDNTPALDSFLAEALAAPLPKVVDADSLNRIAAQPALLPASAKCREALVLTPHEGEFRRLATAFALQTENLSRAEKAKALADSLGCVVLLKGAKTVVATADSDLVTENTTGNPRLATAGTGDVLSGVIGALLAQGLSPANAARLGAFLHGKAADELPAFIADDLPSAVAKIIACKLY